LAFVRWRGNCAQLLTTRYEEGRSRQILIANLQSGYFVPRWVQEDVAQRFPEIEVDWAEIDHALAKGPLGTPPITEEQWNYAKVEHALRQWALTPTLRNPDAAILHSAAQILTNLHALEPPTFRP
jgi:hypothetical protein